MTHYLLVTLDGEVSENQVLGTEDIQSVCNGDLEIYRVGDNGQFQRLTPVNETDVDNWTDVTK